MWAAVLLPPYFRDRNDTRAAGKHSPVSNKLGALSRSFGNRERSRYLPVASSSLGAPQKAGSPLPAGSRHPLTRRGSPQLVPSAPEPQSSAFSILGPPGSSPEAEEFAVEDARFLLAPEVDETTPEATRTRRAIPKDVLASRAARKRRREVLYTLLAASGLSLLMAIGLGGPVLVLHVLIDIALVVYVGLLVRIQRAKAEREIQVAFLPHGGDGVAPSELL
ncbi:MAG TPA: hypothetical protein VFP02_09720, partial [Acidimicrobiales bacterium]|nr:hypothetical protein [Acidimicrobiales bacterium]